MSSASATEQELMWLFFFFSSRRRHTRYWRDWSSDVCSSDLLLEEDVDGGGEAEHGDAAGVARDAEHVGALRRVHGDRVGRAVAAAVRSPQVEVDRKSVV